MLHPAPRMERDYKQNRMLQHWCLDVLVSTYKNNKLYLFQCFQNRLCIFKKLNFLCFRGNAFTSEWITKFAHQKEEVLRPNTVRHCRALWKDSNAIGLVTATAPVPEGSYRWDCTFFGTCTAVCSPALLPHSCSSHVVLLLPIRTVNPASYLKASEPNSIHWRCKYQLDLKLFFLIWLGP